MPHQTETPEQDGPSSGEARPSSGVRDHATFLLGPEGQIETWSAGAERMTGYPGDEIIGQHVSLLYSPKEGAGRDPARELECALEEGQVENEVRWRRKDGSEFPGLVAVTPLRGPAGHARGFVVVLRDLTPQQRAEEALALSEQRFRLLVEGVEDYAIFMLDPVGRIVTWNAGAERIKGYTPNEIIGQHFSRFYPDEDVEAGVCERGLEIARREGRFEEEGWRRRKNGTKFWASVVMTALRDKTGALVGYARVTRDLTQRRKLEDERMRLVQAEESIRLRDEFLSIASHELKTPLTALQLQIQGVQKKVAAVDRTLAARLERAARSGQRLADLIEALLDVSRIATGRFDLRRERLDLGFVVRDLVERLRDAAAKEGCALEVTAPDGIVGVWDRVRVEQVLTNLLSNAVRYGAGAPIRISITQQGGDAILQVGDRGPGIPKQDLARIFGRFERASSMRHYGGLGLGLYVAREIVEAHGGTVSADNPTSGGALFTVRLPLVAAVAAQPPAAGDLH
jgi:PAS domain S-box-containing protein